MKKEEANIRLDELGEMTGWIGETIARNCCRKEAVCPMGDKVIALIRNCRSAYDFELLNSYTAKFTGFGIRELIDSAVKDRAEMKDGYLVRLPQNEESCCMNGIGGK